jgi:hypothetical protein
MPRRTGVAVKDRANKQEEAGWRLLLRHPEFRTDLNALLRLRPTTAEEFGKNKKALQVKWNVWLPYALWRSTIPDEVTPLNVSDFESLFNPAEVHRAVTTVDVDNVFVRWLSAPEAHEIVKASLEGASSGSPDDLITIDLPTPNPALTAEAAQRDKTLTLHIRTDYPIDVLMPLIQQHIRWAQDPTPKRRRLDKVDFYLDVYDRSDTRGEKFSEIALALGRPASTIKSAYVMAKVNIFGSLDAAPSKKAAMLAAFDKEKHFTTCPVCSKAETSDDFCPIAQAALPDDGSQKDQVVRGDFTKVADAQVAGPDGRQRSQTVRVSNADGRDAPDPVAQERVARLKAARKARGG